MSAAVAGPTSIRPTASYTTLRDVTRLPEVRFSHVLPDSGFAEVE